MLASFDFLALIILSFDLHELLLGLEYFDLLAFFPDSIHFLTIILPINSFTMLFSVEELALIHSTVRP